MWIRAGIPFSKNGRNEIKNDIDKVAFQAIEKKFKWSLNKITDVLLSQIWKYQNNDRDINYLKPQLEEQNYNISSDYAKKLEKAQYFYKLHFIGAIDKQIKLIQWNQ